MKTIKINFCGFWNSFNKEKNFFTKILSKHFVVEISETPDFVICSNRGKPFEYVQYDCVRLIVMGENISPDFTIFDYCIGFDYLTFGDRYFRLPYAFYNDSASPWAPSALSESEATKILSEKKHFCNFIYRHPSSHGIREKFFTTLNEYKPVVSAGSQFNNTGSKNGCSWVEKYEYVKASKFTIACDSIEYDGFVTEKIVQAFDNHSIPIYFGNKRIDDEFNTKAFIWCKTKEDFDATIERIKFVDSNDDEYIKMLCENPLKDPNSVKACYEELEKFLVNIFSQEPENAYRRVKYFAADDYERHLKNYYRIYSKTPNFVHKFLDKIKK
ncbi:MAG: hypothetical protein IJO44_06305 [Clostridia bacterium]|nr:hypothetical protein [Clostridia bacterium]